MIDNIYFPAMEMLLRPIKKRSVTVKNEDRHPLISSMNGTLFHSLANLYGTFIDPYSTVTTQPNPYQFESEQSQLPIVGRCPTCKVCVVHRFRPSLLLFCFRLARWMANSLVQASVVLCSSFPLVFSVVWPADNGAVISVTQCFLDQCLKNAFISSLVM